MTEQFRHRRRMLGIVGCVSLAVTGVASGAQPVRKVVLIAGTKSHGPGHHEYEKGVKLLQHCLDTSPDVKNIRSEVHLDGWPKDPTTLDDADTIVMFSDGSDHDEQAHPLLRGDRLAVIDKQMRRGCGFIALHYTVFVPSQRGGKQFLEWLGGYFDYENGPLKNKRKWYSKIRTATTTPQPAAPKHPICRGLQPFKLREEYYYNIRFRENDPRLVRILTTSIPGEPDLQTVAWAVERRDGGRGFGFTGGHFHDNWRIENFRKMMLNAVLWTAKADVPAGGVRSKLPADAKRQARDGAETPVRQPATAPTTSVLVDQGKFAAALHPHRQHAGAAWQEAYQKPPLTVECWAKLESTNGFNLLVANNVKESSTHWEIYTVNDSGTFAAFLPGMSPSVIDSKVNIVDSKWHYLAMVYDIQRVRLHVDARKVADVALQRGLGQPRNGPLFFGGYPPQSLRCAGLLDEVRISNRTRAIDTVPEKPLTADDATIGLWHFDRVDHGRFDDASTLNNPAVIDLAAPRKAASSPEKDVGESDYESADERLKIVRIDRSPNESFLAVKTDTEGRIFVGGREAVLVYEPDTYGGYAPARELVRFPPDTWVTDIEIRGDDLYIMTTPALYRMPGGRTRRENLTVERLIWGLPWDLHVSFDGLAWGPQGDLYFTSGDPLLVYGDFNRADHWGHWTIYSQPEGTKVPYTGAGAIYRCRPDGSEFQVVAGGTRGSCGLAFDHHWNLFTNDNDHESLPDRYSPARLMHVTPHVDFAWPRGWMATKSPDRSDLLETMTTSLGRGVPVGQSYYNESYLPAEYRHNVLLARWGRLSLTRFAIAARGASYSAAELPLIDGRGQTRPVGVAVGRGGRLFVTIAYMGRNEWSPKYVSDLLMVTRANDTPAHPFESYDATTASAARLWSELSDASWWRRNRAHVEILRRSGDMLAAAAGRLARIKDDDPALMHLPWLAGAGRNPEAGRLLTKLATHPRAEVRLQAVRALIEFYKPADFGEPVTLALSDANPRVQLAALGGLFDDDAPFPESAIITLARSEDSYLRQTATKLLAERATREQLFALTESSDAATRLAAVLATGFRLTVPPVHGLPPEQVKLAYHARNAKFEIQYADAKIDLQSLGKVGSYTTAVMWQQAPHSDEQEVLFARLIRMLDDPIERVGLQAAYWLYLLADPRSEPLVVNTRRTIRERRLLAGPLRTVEKVWYAGPFTDADDSFKPVHPPESGVIDLTATYSGNVTWREILTTGEGHFALAGKSEASQDVSHYAYFRLQSAQRRSAMLTIGSGGRINLWHNGRVVEAADGRALLDLQPGSNDFLVRSGASSLDLSYRALGRVVETLPERLGMASLARRLREAGASANDAQIGPAFLEVDWSEAARKGDADRGRKLFGALACVKCHAITSGQTGGGAPSLTEAGRRFTVAYLVESILLPSRQVADLFRSTAVITDEGDVYSGVVTEETADKLTLLQADATRIDIAKSTIERRSLQEISAMPTGLIREPRELRDLLAYLLSDSPRPP